MPRGIPGETNAQQRDRIEAMKVDDVNRIWNYTRFHRASLESERHTRLIREMVDKAVDESLAFSLGLLESNKTTIAGLRTMNTELRARVKLLEGQNERLRETSETDDAT